jgi:hypothetical protein
MQRELLLLLLLVMSSWGFKILFQTQAQQLLQQQHQQRQVVWGCLGHHCLQAGVV